MTPPASAAAAQPARRHAPPRPRKAPARPRRVSGPGRPAARPAPRTAPAESTREGLLAGLLGAAEALSSHRLLDRLIRGRLWIGIVAFALIGIVTLQLGLLRLNSGIGRALVREATLQTENAALSIEDSELSSGTRVESQAQQLGMRLSAISSLHFLSSHEGSDATRAAEVLRKPLAPAGEAPGGEVPATGSSEAGEAPKSGEAAITTETSSSGEAAKTGGAPTQQASAQSTAGPARAGESSEGTGAASSEAGTATAPGAAPSSATPPAGETGGAAAAPGG